MCYLLGKRDTPTRLQPARLSRLAAPARRAVPAWFSSRGAGRARGGPRGASGDLGRWAKVSPWRCSRAGSRAADTAKHERLPVPQWRMVDATGTRTAFHSAREIIAPILQVGKARHGAGRQFATRGNGKKNPQLHAPVPRTVPLCCFPVLLPRHCVPLPGPAAIHGGLCARRRRACRAEDHMAGGN